MSTPPIIIWKHYLSVGVVVVDEDHKKLIKMINRLFGATLSPDPGQVLRGVLDELTEYVTTHFNREEALMHRLNYEGLEEHQQEHQKLLHAASRFKKNLESGLAMNLKGEIETSLRDWLVTHIQKQDMEMGKFLNENGIR